MLDEGIALRRIIYNPERSGLTCRFGRCFCLRQRSYGASLLHLIHRKRSPVSPVGSVSASACGRGLHRRPAPSRGRRMLTHSFVIGRHVCLPYIASSRLPVTPGRRSLQSVTLPAHLALSSNGEGGLRVKRARRVWRMREHHKIGARLRATRNSAFRIPHSALIYAVNHQFFSITNVTMLLGGTMNSAPVSVSSRSLFSSVIYAFAFSQGSVRRFSVLSLLRTMTA